MKQLHAIVSIHDLAPATLDEIDTLLALLPDRCKRKLSMLVIPGLDWRPADLDRLRAWQDQGFRLCGHGWTHEVQEFKNLYHRIHAVLISRNAAEHLSLTRDELSELLQRNYAWFGAHDLTAPDCYVPPAWAMGALKRVDLQTAPFRYYESTRGYFDSDREQLYALPLVGFEADTRMRKHMLSIWNNINAHCASSNRPLRISIHPHDHRLLLKEQMLSYLNRVTQAISYNELG